jgi:hypothetical protein
MADEETKQLDPDADTEELPEDLQAELLTLWRKCSQDNVHARRQEIRDVRRSEFYWRGNQYIWWSASAQDYRLPTQGRSEDDEEDMPRFQNVTNIYQSKGLSLVASLAGAPPRIRFFPEDPDDPDDIERATKASTLVRVIERWNPLIEMLQQWAYHAWNGGVIGGYVRYVSDEKYGVEDIDELEEESVETTPETISCPKCGFSSPAEFAAPPVPCPDCGQQLTSDNVKPAENAPVPSQSGTKTLPKGREIISVVGGLHLQRPMSVNDLKDFHYLGYPLEVHYAKLRAAYPEKADKISEGQATTSENTFERQARLSIAEGTTQMTQTGDSLKNLVTYQRVWFRNEAFYQIDDKAKRDELIRLFPKGCYVAWAGDVFCEARAESMDDHWVIKHALPGQGQHRQAVGSSAIPIQDRFNTESNICDETYEYGLPTTYYDAKWHDDEAFEEQDVEPGANVPVPMDGPGDQIANHIFTHRADSVSPDMAQHMMNLMGPILDMVTGIYPAAVGGEEAGAGETLGGYSLMRDASMGRIGIPYSVLKQWYAEVQTLAVDDLLENASGTLKLPTLGRDGDYEGESVDLDSLGGKCKAYPEGDENFPELWTQKRETFKNVMDSPWGQELMKHPDNRRLGIEMTGIHELVDPAADAANKALRVIKQLTKIEDGADDALSMPPEVDKDVDEHAAEAAEYKRWLNSQEGQRMKMEHPVAYANVRAQFAAQMAAMPKPEQEEKPLNTTLNFKDAPPEAQAEILSKFLGITVNPQDFLMQAALEHIKKKPGTPPDEPPGTPTLGKSPVVPGKPTNGGTVHM